MLACFWSNTTMLVCHCHRVCEREIQRAVDAGADSVHAVGAACGAGTSCGGCLPTIDAIVQQAAGAEAVVKLAVLDDARRKVA
ncbi:MAG: (2Fe-2S)-binding protein [Polyangiaceae bacterium]